MNTFIERQPVSASHKHVGPSFGWPKLWAETCRRLISLFIKMCWL